MCVGQQRDVLSLQEALAPKQPASTPDTQQRVAEHLAGPATMPGASLQHTNKAVLGSTVMSQHSAWMEDSRPVPAAASDLLCHEALESLGQETAAHRPGKGKSRPPFMRELLSRQAAKAKRRVCAREQRRTQAAQGAASTADSSGDADGAGAIARRVRGERPSGKGRSRPPMAGASLPKQAPAAQGRQRSQRQGHGVADRADGVRSTSSVEAARARLQVWTREQGLGSAVSGPEAAAQTAEVDQAPAEEPAAGAGEAARQSKRRIREPYAQAILDIPKQLAARAKRSIKASSHLIICSIACPDIAWPRPDLFR